MSPPVPSRAALLREALEKATERPWELGDVWSWAGCGFNGNGPDECVLCSRMGEPVWRGRSNINGKRVHSHKHRNPHPYQGDHRISNPLGLVAGNYDYEEGGIIDPADAAVIVAAVNALGGALDVIDALAVLGDEPWAECAEVTYDDELPDELSHCVEHFDDGWPCRAVRLRDALAKWEAGT